MRSGKMRLTVFFDFDMYFREFLKIGFLRVVKRIRMFFFISFGIFSAFFPSNNRLFYLENAKTPPEISRKIAKRQFLKIPFI